LFLLLAGTLVPIADEFRTAAISAVRVEWRAALDQLSSEINTQPAVASAFAFSGKRRLPAFDPRLTPALVQLNAVTSPIFTGIGRSPVPVLLPFDTAAFLDARLSGAPAGLSLSRYQADFRPVDLFDAGPAGYDAMFALEPGAGDGMPQRTFARPVEVQITGSVLTYDISDPLGEKGGTGQGIISAIPRPAPLHPRRLCALCLYALRCSLCGVDPMSRQCPSGAAACLPRSLSRRRAFSQSAARRRWPALAAANGYSIRQCRAAG